MSNNNVNFDATSYAMTQALTPIGMDQYYHMALQWSAVVATPAAKTFEPGVVEISTVQTIADAGVREIQTMTFPTKAAATQGDYIVFYDTLGKKYAISIDKNGTGVEPTGAIWSSIVSSRKKVCYIGAQTTAAQVAAKVLLSIRQIPEITSAVMVWVDSGSGVLTGTQALVGSVTNPVPKDATDGTAGGLLGAQTTAGVASNLNGKYFSLYAGGTNALHVFWLNVNSEGVAPVVANSTLHEVALVAGDTADNNATAIELVIEAVTGFNSSAVTDTITVTCTTKGNTTVVNANDSGFAVATGTPGIDDAFANGFVTNEIVIASHGYVTGLKAALTTSAADAPDGTSATDYWIIKVDANTIKLATSAANAALGTAVDIIDAGSGIHTLTPAAISGGVLKLQESIDGSNWFDIASATDTITATAVGDIQTVSKMSLIRPYLTLTTGQISLEIKSFQREE